MGEPDLSFIKSDIKLEQTAPLNRRRVVALFNCYLMRMADFLNDFVQRAERLILEAERKLYVADTRLRILESKVNRNRY
uniref:TolC family protein n=1 Tax=Heterorhabditis bacteriophora TaxID=37862 RepID=A0A1I7WWC4_HETBA